MAFIYKLNTKATIPLKANRYDAAYDLMAVEEVKLYQDSVTMVPTGLVIAAPIGYYIQLKSRSSLALKGIRVEAGVIDAGYRGEIKVILSSSCEYKINVGDKIAQFIFVKVPDIDLIEVNQKPDPIDERKDGGFGSSGK